MKKTLLASTALLSLSLIAEGVAQQFPAPRFRDRVVTVIQQGAKGDGVTDDTAAFNACGAISVCSIPPSPTCYKITAQVTGEFVGSGITKTCITASNISGPAIFFNGGTVAQKLGLRIGGFRLTGNVSSGSIGVQIKAVALANIDSLYVEGFGTGLDTTDVDQTQISNSVIRFNTNGVIHHLASLFTAPNSLTYVNTGVGNNSATGIHVIGAVNFNYYGGSIQYNGVVGGGGAQYGLLLDEMYGAVLSGVDMEGNGGQGDIIVSNATVPTNVTMVGLNFLRGQGFGPTVGYGTNHILIQGTQPTLVKIQGSRFWSGTGYVPSGARPSIANVNASAKISDDGSTLFSDATEAPVWAGSAQIPSLVIQSLPTSGTATGTLCTTVSGQIYAKTTSGACL